MIDARIRAWLEKLEERAKQSSKEYSTPEVVTGYYAADKVMDVWKISNGRTWWDDPVLVREFHEYADGTVHAGYYVEGVQTFSRQEVEDSGLQAIRPADQITTGGTTKQWSQAPDNRATPPTGAWLSLLQMLRHIATVDLLEGRPGACGGDCQGLIV